jgi:hypothetical protein
VLHWERRTESDGTTAEELIGGEELGLQRKSEESDLFWDAYLSASFLQNCARTSI